jgi:hypothetical protein
MPAWNDMLMGCCMKACHTAVNTVELQTDRHTMANGALQGVVAVSGGRWLEMGTEVVC